MQMSTLPILNAIRERPLSAGQFGTASARFWPAYRRSVLYSRVDPKAGRVSRAIKRERRPI
jgi:hypothetical protein